MTMGGRSWYDSFGKRNFTSQHILIRPDEKYKGTTGKWIIYSTSKPKGGDILGVLKWYWAWRRFVFWPELGTLYDASCLEDIRDFIDQAMKDYKTKERKE